jgi:polysaccharide export outer membrane protein
MSGRLPDWTIYGIAAPKNRDSRAQKGRSLRAFAILAGSLALAACASDVTVVSSGDRYAAANKLEAYNLGPGDRVRLTVYNEPALSGLYQVSAQGKLALPLIGDVDAIDLTPAELAARTQARLAQGFLQNPRVSAEIADYRPFFILGEVVQAGQFPYLPGMTAMEAVATARGFTPRSQRKFVFIRRDGEQEEVAYRVTPGLRVYPGDTIRVEERWF